MLDFLFLLVYLLIGVLFAGFCVYLDQKDYGCAILYVVTWPIMFPLIAIVLAVAVILNMVKGVDSNEQL